MIAIVLRLFFVNRVHRCFNFQTHDVPHFLLRIDHALAAVAGEMDHDLAPRPENDDSLPRLAPSGSDAFILQPFAEPPQDERCRFPRLPENLLSPQRDGLDFAVPSCSAPIAKPYDRTLMSVSSAASE